MIALHVLIVDDEPAIRQVLALQIKKAGHNVQHVGDGASALELLLKGDMDVCICDIRLPGMDGVEVLRKVRAEGQETYFLMMTAYASVSTAIEAMKQGAYDYLMKPLRNEDVLRRLNQIADMMGLKDENLRLKRLVDDKPVEEFASCSPSMQKVERLVNKVARTSGVVLITGESGTGKTFIARRIHDLSQRAEWPFVSVNCGAIPDNLLESEFFGYLKGAFTGADRSKKGLFREADGGTLFLDEVSELPLPLQVKLLHVLEDKEVRPLGSEQTRKVDVRIIAATNREVEKMVESGDFREDLFYRLNVFQIHMPSLVERREDLPGLIRFFLTREERRMGLEQSYRVDPVVEEILVSHKWSGNLRELQNVLARTLILAEDNEITVADLPPQVTQTQLQGGVKTQPEESQLPLRELVRRYEIKLITDAVERSEGDRQQAAKKLGIGLSTLYRKLEENEASGSVISETKS